MHELFPIDMKNSDQKQIVIQLMAQMTTVGFCLITNVEGHDEESLHSAIKAFHDLPLEKKLSLAPKHDTPMN